MKTEVFREVAEEEMPQVLATFKQDWPKHFLIYQILTVMEEYKKLGTMLKHNLYLFGDYDTGVYLVLLEMEQMQPKMIHLYLYTKNPDLSSTKKALQTTQLIPWQTTEYFFAITDRKFLQLIQEALAVRGIQNNTHDNTLFWFPPEKALKIDSLPDDVYMDFLDGSYAKEIDDNWPHRFPGSDLVHKEHIEKNFGLGIFRKSDKKLACSALSNFSGGIFTLYTDPQFRGKKYAYLLVKQMVQEIRKRGRIPFATVIVGNTPSERVFKRAGFEDFANVDYIFPVH